MIFSDGRAHAGAEGGRIDCSCCATYAATLKYVRRILKVVPVCLGVTRCDTYEMMSRDTYQRVCRDPRQKISREHLELPRRVVESSQAQLHSRVSKVE